MIRRTTPSPASNTYIVPATITPMLVRERSAVMTGEPTPSTIAVVDAAAFGWDRSQPAEPTTIAPVARGVMRRLSFIEHSPYAPQSYPNSAQADSAEKTPFDTSPARNWFGRSA